MTNTVPTATCAACFATHKVTGKARPVRHGFSIITTGRGNGHNGAWHTGPCGGQNFPHYGISADGTRWALSACQRAIAGTETTLSILATRPMLAYSYQRYNPRATSKADRYTTITVEIVDGAARTYVPESGDYLPAYDALLAERVTEATNQLERLRSDERFLEGKIAEWKPAAAVEVARKVATVHYDAAWGKGRGDTRVALCQRWAFHPSATLRTTDKAAVTCTRCRKSLGI